MHQMNYGPMSENIRQYLQLRQSFEMAIKNTRLCLEEFDRYLAVNFQDAQTITREMIQGYLATLPHLSKRTRYVRVIHLRQFCRFLLQSDQECYLPERDLVPLGEVLVKPHIYSDEEIRQLIQLARFLTPPDSLRPHTYATLLGLLWVTGLRIGEAIRLDLDDVDLEAGMLRIENTKFHKSRLVPLSRSSTSALYEYREKRDSYGHDTEATSPFFVNERARRCSSRTVHDTFHQLILKSRIRTLQGTIPRLHDFRHTFATLWLTEVYEEGKDPFVFLPILATFLGHANISNTQVYLHPSVEVLRQAGEKLHSHFHLLKGDRK